MSKQYSIRVSDEAAEVLDQQDNKSQYVEQLLVGKPPEQNIPWQKLENNIKFYIDEKLSSQAPNSPSKPDNTANSSDIPEHLLPNCCKTQDKCVHWQYGELNERWTHKLTGEVKEAM